MIKTARQLTVALVVSQLVLIVSGCGAAQKTVDAFSSGSKMPQPVKRVTADAEAGAGLITEAYSTDKCGSLSRGGFIWFTDSTDFSAWLAPMDQTESEEIRSRVPFDQQGALLVDFGSLPTAGYRIKLMSNRLQVAGEKGVVKVDLVRPGVAVGEQASAEKLPVRKKRPQVMSHPCLLLVLPRNGYSVLELQTQLGDVLTSFENN